MMRLINPDKENSHPGSPDYGIAEAQSYLKEETNPSIKKYKSVVKEYHKKYHKEMTNKPLGRQVSTKSLMKEVLSKGEMLKEDLSSEENTMLFWMIEFIRMDKNVTK